MVGFPGGKQNYHQRSKPEYPWIVTWCKAKGYCQPGWWVGLEQVEFVDVRTANAQDQWPYVTP